MLVKKRKDMQTVQKHTKSKFIGNGLTPCYWAAIRMNSELLSDKLGVPLM